MPHYLEKYLCLVHLEANIQNIENKIHACCIKQSMKLKCIKETKKKKKKKKKKKGYDTIWSSPSIRYLYLEKHIVSRV